MNFLDLLAIKVAYAPPDQPAAPKPPPAIRQLLLAKAESDRRNYAAKAAILRKMIVENPDSFEIDSEDNGIVGLTHGATGFQIHLPKTSLPPVKLRRRPPRMLLDSGAAI